MYKFKMSIGDWSDDGHGKHEDYIVESNLPVEQVREAHFAMKSRIGINIEDLCAEYEQDCIGEDDADILRQLGWEFEDEPHENNDLGVGYYMTPQDIAELWLFLLMKSDSELQLRIVEDYPTMHFYGFDDKKRHIEQVGYGCF